MSKVGRWIRSKRFWKRMVIGLVLVPVLFFSVVVLIVYAKQDAIVQDLVHDLNKDFTGHIEIKDSHVSLFANFPYISIDLEEVKVHEDKTDKGVCLVDLQDIYVGFDLWTILSGKMDIKKIKLSHGELNLVQHKDGEFNIVKALTSQEEVEDVEEAFHLNLKKIELEEIDLTKLNEANNLKVEAYITDAHSKFKTSGEHVKASLDARFELNLIKDGDTTILKHKHIDFDTEIDFLKGKDILTLAPTVVHLEGTELNAEGSINFLEDINLDVKFSANKPNFDLFVAMAPEEYIPTLKQYENKGKIFLKTSIKGRSINGHRPKIEASFGCKNGYIKNQKNNKTIKGLNFEGSFTNGKDRNGSTMRLDIHDFTARPERGKFYGDVVVSNFKAPDVNMTMKTDFQMEFLSRFFDIKSLRGLKGKAIVEINYHDIIDLEHPEHSIAKMNESYHMKVKLDGVSFVSKDYELPIERFDFWTQIDGHQANIKRCDMKVGSSDLTISGMIDDWPAVVHHTDKPVDTRLQIHSKLIDLYELTGKKEGSINEQIEDLSLDLDFKASAKSLTESQYLPVGEFFIENFYAKLKHYPHTLHDFHADVLIDERDLRVVDFKGMIDKSDFLFTGKLKHYEKWFDEHPGGDSKIEFNLKSKMLQLEDLFAYKGENSVPEEYRHEEFDNLTVHGYTYLHYADELKSIDLQLDHFNAAMKVHPLRFENFMGRVHYENEHLVVEDFHGKLGKSKFKTTLHYYLGKDESVKKRDNHFSLTASRLDMDQLLKYNPKPAHKKGKEGATAAKKVDHDAGFNIYELPFTDMTYHLDIKHFNYHKYLMKNIKGELRTTPKHYIYLDRLNMDAAGGHFNINGYFNGSNPKKIYFSPDIKVENIDLDKLLFKFDNFGQDYIVAENLHGKFSGKITGKIHMHNDLVPIIDDSEIHLDAHVLYGRLENYALLEYMTDYFKDKNLNKVLFDTLDNHLDVINGEITIPTMKINSTLGHIEISGKQHVDGKMEYYLRIPWKMITQTASSKLFKKKKKEAESDDQIDEIQYGNKKTKYVNVKIVGDENGYSFSLSKKKKKKNKK